jgi:glycine oxidase
MLGPSGIDGLVVATGHHRNGILLTPLTAEAVSAYVLTGHLPGMVEPFTPERFTDKHLRSTTTTGRMATAEAR